jgi:acetyltransferase-like isoleucine patch superfamily enzyme
MGIINRISYYACRIKDSFRTNVFRLNENIKIGRKSVVHSNALLKINNGGKISIGKNSEILFGSVIMTYGGSISIGDRCSINPYSIIYGHGNGVKIGNDVMIAGHTMIVPFNHNFSDLKIKLNEQGIKSHGIVIEDNVWIGAGCKILDGVKIEKGSIIAAGAVVSKSIPPNSIYGGVPAKKIKVRT